MTKSTGLSNAPKLSLYFKSREAAVATLVNDTTDPKIDSLLILVPVANLGLLFFLAFAQWPALARHDKSAGLEF